MAYRVHDGSSTSLSQGNYRELLKSFGKLDYGFDRHLHDRLQGAERCKSGGVFTGARYHFAAEKSQDCFFDSRMHCCNENRW